LTHNCLPSILPLPKSEFLSKKEGLQVTPEEVIEVCKQNLASYKKPQTVEFVAELPKNNYGKIERKKLKEKYWQGYLRRVN
jgi:acyl-CoA synthetase (AMP-forming)/AMP-acid ligase II